MSGTRSGCPKGPAIDAGLGRAALVILGYGSAGGRAALEARRRGLATCGAFGETAVATLFGRPRLEEAVAAVAGAPVLLVPLLMARGLTYRHLTDRLAHLEAGGRIVLCPEIGRHPGLAAALAAQADHWLAARGWRPAETGLLLVGHGTRRHAASRRATLGLAARIAGLKRFAETAAAFLEEAPGVEAAAGAMRARHLLALGCFAESGRHAARDLPRRLALCRRPPVYGGSAGGGRWIEPLILDQALAGGRRAGLGRLP